MGRPRGITIIETIVLVIILLGAACLTVAGVLHFRTLQQRQLSADRMRGIYSGLYDFAKANENKAPLFYRRSNGVNYYQDTHMISGGKSHGPASPIWQIMQDRVQSPEELFCPSETSPYFQYDTSENPWAPYTLRKITRMGFSFKPMQSWFSGMSDRLKQQNMNRLPTMSFSSSSAVISNVLITPEKALTVHRGRGTNVVYGDGRVQFVPTEKFYNRFSDMPEPHRLSLWNMNTVKQVWRALDDASKAGN